MTGETTLDLRDPQRAEETVREVLFRLESGLIVRRTHVRQIGLIAEHWKIDRRESEGYDKYLHRLLETVNHPIKEQRA